MSHFRLRYTQSATNTINKRLVAYSANALGVTPLTLSLITHLRAHETDSYLVIGLFAAGIASSLTVVGIIVQVFGRRLMNSETNKDAWYVRLPWLHIRAGAITLIGLGYLMHVAFG